MTKNGTKKNHKITKYLIIWATFLCLFSPLKTLAAEEDGWLINLNNVELKVMIQQVADITGKAFIISDNVGGNVTVISEKPLKKDEVYDLFLTTLKSKGYVVVHTSEGEVIMNAEAAKENNTPPARKGGNNDELVSKVITLKNASSQELLLVLRPLTSHYGYITASDFSNSLVVVDHASNIAKIEQLISQLDKTESGEMEVVKLKTAWVGNVASILKELAYNQSTQKAGNKFQNLRMVANEYDNSIILKGDAGEREIAKSIIAKLDSPSGGEGNLQVIYLNYADATNVAEILKTLIVTGKSPTPTPVAASGTTAAAGASESGETSMTMIAGTNEQISIQPDKTLNALVIKADPQTINSIRSIISKLDIKRPQVLIEAAIVEVSGDLSETLGTQIGIGKDATVNGQFAASSFDESGPALASILSGATTTTVSPITGGLSLAVGKNNNFSVLVQALAKNSEANLLSTPSITTLDNQAAEILVGQNVPFVTGSYSNDAGGTNPFTTIQRQDIGISLKVTPHIHQGSAVSMDIQQEVSSLVASAQTNTQASDLITNKRSIKTSILAQNKEIIVIGGLIQDDVTHSQGKIPILGDIPIIGNLFKSTSDSKTKRNLFVFIHPVILNEKKDVADVTNDRLNKIYDLDLGKEEDNLANREKWCRDFNNLFGNNETRPKSCAPIENPPAPLAKVEDEAAPSAGDPNKPELTIVSIKPAKTTQFALPAAPEYLGLGNGQ